MGSSDLMESSQRTLHIATLILNNGAACAVEKLQQKCRLFPVSSRQIGELCALPESPLKVLDDNRIGLTKDFLVELRSRLDTFEGACNAAPRCNGATFLVPAVPGASLVVPPAKDSVVQDLDIKEVRGQTLIAVLVHTYITLLQQFFYLPFKENVLRTVTCSFACLQKSTLPKRIPEFQDYVVLGEEGSGMPLFHLHADVFL